MAGVRKRLGSLLGPTGRAAKIASITSEAVPATTPSTVVVGGTDIDRTLHFKIQQGMPAAAAVPQDQGVAGFVASAGSATRVALEAASVSVAEDTMGLVLAGKTFDYARLQQAAEQARVSKRRLWAAGEIITSQTLDINSDADLGGLTYKYTGTGVAVRVGLTAGGATRDLVVTTPRTMKQGKPQVGWDATSCGIEIANLQGAAVTIPHISSFHTGLRETSYATGNVHNTLTLGQIVNNKVNIHITSGAGGWTNQNVHINGQLAHYSAEGTSVAGSRQILIDEAPPGGYPINNHTFIGTSVEGLVPEFTADIGGYNNMFFNLRWEAGGAPRVRWGSNATRNQIMYGHSADLIVETFATNAGVRNHIVSPNRARYGSLELANPGGDDAAADIVKAALTPGYAVSRSVSLTGMKRVTDAHNRIELDHKNGRIRFGLGAVAPDKTIGLAGSALQLEGFQTTTSATGGAATALPANPAGYLSIFIGGEVRKIPYY